MTSLGECFNYLFDEQNSKHALFKLFRRIYEALLPNGVLIFDLLELKFLQKLESAVQVREGKDWLVLFRAEGDQKRNESIRHLTTFRKAGALWRRDQETHRLKLYEPQEIAAELRRIGFRVCLIRGYGSLRFRFGHVGFLARKP